MRPMVYSSNILFDFDAIVDMDIAIVRFFKEYLSDSIYVDYDMMQNNDEYFFKAMLIDREDKNPVKMMLRNDTKDSADLIYNELIADHYEELLKMAPPLSVFDLMITASKTNIINCTVLCKNQYEKQYIKKVSKECITIDYSNELNLDLYNCLYIKNFDFLLKFPDLRAKDVYILSYKYNLEPRQDNIPRLDIFKKISNSIKLHIISPYHKEFIEPI